MKDFLLSKLLFILFYLPKYDEEICVINGKQYLILDKAKMKKSFNIFQFILITMSSIIGYNFSQSYLFLLIIIFEIITFIIDWLRLPKNIFDYLEEIL